MLCSVFCEIVFTSVWVAEQLLLDLDEYVAFTDVETGENLSGVKEGFLGVLVDYLGTVCSDFTNLDGHFSHMHSLS